MSSEHKRLIDNYVDSFNNIDGSKDGLYENVNKRISEIDNDIKRVYQHAHNKKYPSSSSLSDAAIALGIQKKMSAFQFVSVIAPNIQNRNYDSEQKLLNEIRDTMNRDDREYLSGLFDACDTVLNQSFKPGEPPSKFFSSLAELKKEYESKAGITDITNEIETLKTRRGEYEYILYSIEKNLEGIILPRTFVELSHKVDESKNQELRSKFLELTPLVNDSLAFLTKKGLKVKL